MKKIYILGILLGLLVPYIGLFFGLQVSPILGNILAWPLILVAAVSGTPIGMFSAPLWILAVAISIAFWIIVLKLIAKLRS